MLLVMTTLLLCTLSLVAQCIVIGPVSVCVCVCVCARLQQAGGRAVSEPYYSQRARSVCVFLSAFFIATVIVVL